MPAAGDDALQRAARLVAAAERDSADDVASARADTLRARELFDTMERQLAAGQLTAAAASATVLAMLARSIGVRLDTAAARSIGLRAGRALADAERPR